ncbi:hypothetical protein AB0N89_06065 [Amycolatopsis sp. NPDC089917]|uniref:hypothetical protein n=1 Tax=Amycolatopsis sp. NPDC089917 TaxID=3155187 RepID=UPI003439C4DE
MSIGEMDDELEDLDTLFVAWQERSVQLRNVSDQVRWLAARFSSYHGSHSTGDIRIIVESFRKLSKTADRRDFESLNLRTSGLHNRGVDIMHPDLSAKPVPSPFVRRMPPLQEDIEAKRSDLLGRHATMYEVHIRHSIEHFYDAWMALIEGSLICDWEMIDDEFPKLAELADEIDRAFAIWSSLHR